MARGIDIGPNRRKV